MYSIAASRGPPSFTRTPDYDVTVGELVGDSNLHNSSSEDSINSTTSSSGVDAALYAQVEVFDHQSAEVDCQNYDTTCKNKGVIEYDKRCEERCSHTTVQPSKMMALAMELQLSNRGKASKMFRLGKQKAQSDSDEEAGEGEKETEEMSKLAHLWVVADTETSSQGNTPSTATHLQPSLVNADFVFQRTAAPDTLSGFSPQKDPVVPSGEMLAEDLALLADISVADLVGTADHDVLNSNAEVQQDTNKQSEETDEITLLRKEEKGHSLTAELKMSKDVSTTIQQTMLGDNESETKQEMEKDISEIPNEITPPHKEVADLSTIGADQGVTYNDTALSINYDYGTTDLPEKGKIETNSEENVESFTSDKVKLSLNSKAITDSELSKHALDASNISNILLTKSEGQNDYECKSLVSDHQEICSDDPSNETAVNDIIMSCEDNGNTLLTKYCEEQLPGPKENKKDYVLADNNNNLVAAEINDQKTKLTLEKLELEESCTSSKTDGNLSNHDISGKKLDEGDFKEKKVRNEVANSFQCANLEVEISSDSTLSPLSSSLVSVTSMDSLTSDSSQSLVMNSSSRAVMTSDGTKLNITSQETKTLGERSSNYLFQPSPLTYDNQTQTDAVTNNKEIADSIPGSINSPNCTLTPIPSTCINGNENRSSEGHDETHDNERLVKELDCGGWPRPWSGSLQDKSENQEEPCSTEHTRIIECEISNSEKAVTESNLQLVPELTTCEVVCKSEVSLSIDSQKVDNNTCTDCENAMALCCCKAKKKKSRSYEIIRAQEATSSIKYVQTGNDPIVESLRASQKRTLIAGSDHTKNELAKTERIKENHSIEESVENGYKLNGNLATEKMQFVVDDDSNKINDDGLRVSQLLLDTNQNSKLHKLNEQNNKEDRAIMHGENVERQQITIETALTDQHDLTISPVKVNDRKVAEDPMINCSISTEQNLDVSLFGHGQTIKETTLVNKNPRVKVSNDYMGSKISLKRNDDGNDVVGSTALRSTNLNDNVHRSGNEAVVDERKHVIISETITSTTAMPLQAEIRAERNELSEKQEMINMNTLASVSIADTQISEKKLLNKSLEAKPPRSNIVRTSSMSRAVEIQKNTSSIQPNKSEVVGVGHCTISLARDSGQDKSNLSSEYRRRPHVVVRTSDSKPSPRYIRTNEVAFKKAREMFNNTEEKRHNLLKTNSLQNIATMDPHSKSPRRGAASPQRTYSSSVFVSIGSQRAKSANERRATPSPSTDSPWRLRQQSLTRRANDATSNSSAQRTHVYRQWSNRETSVPVERTVRPQNQEQLESPKRQNTNATTKVSERKANTSGVSLRTGVSDKPPRSPVLGRISSTGRFEKRSIQQNNYGSRYKSQARWDRKEMSMLGNGPVPRSDTAASIPSNEDASGVVTSPRMTVKEIRARYKSRDYENFAIPKARTASTADSSRKGSEECTKQRKTSENHSDVFRDDNSSNQQVAQQVMGLFQGALDFEKELAVFEQEAKKSYSGQREHITPLKQNGHVVVRTSSSSSSDQQEIAKEIPQITTTSPRKLKSSVWPPAHTEVEKIEKTDIKASIQKIKNETESVSSFDESLDLFYNVLNDLSA